MLQLPTDANKSLIALFDRAEANEDEGDTRYLTRSYVPELHVLLNFLDELGDDDVAGARQGAVLDEKERNG